MKNSLAIVVAASLLTLACHGSKNIQRKDQQYDVVTEGSANGVTSTINGPGENVPPVSTTPITGTGAAADTTTAFTLPTATEGNPTAGGNLAGTLPSSGGMTSASGMPSVPQPAAPSTATRPRPQPQHTTTQPPAQPPTQAPPPPPRQAEPRPAAPAPPTTTQAPPPPPATDTSATTTDTSGTKKNPPPATSTDKTPPPDNNPPPDQQKPQPPPPPPPPPPPATDTIG